MARPPRTAVIAPVLAVSIVTGLWFEHAAPLELPPPTGPFPIGRTAVTWPDGLDAWLWYPAATGAPAAAYVPEPVRARWQEARPRVINFLTRDLSRVRGHAAENAALSGGSLSYPVLIFRGGGSSSSLNYSAMTEDLASHGYIVLGLDIASAANPERCDGRPDEDRCAIEAMTPLLVGLGRAIDRLRRLAADDTRWQGRADVSRLGVFGHSFGGAQAAAFCAEDARCKAGVNIDGRLLGRVADRGIPVPFLTLLSDHDGEVDEVSAGFSRGFVPPTIVSLRTRVCWQPSAARTTSPSAMTGRSSRAASSAVDCASSAACASTGAGRSPSPVPCARSSIGL